MYVHVVSNIFYKLLILKTGLEVLMRLLVNIFTKKYGGEYVEGSLSVSSMRFLVVVRLKFGTHLLLYLSRILSIEVVIFKFLLITDFPHKLNY